MSAASPLHMPVKISGAAATIIQNPSALILGLIKPSLLFYPYKVWMKLGHILGWVNSRIILGLVFVIVLQPISLIMKIFNYDPLRKKKNNQKSYRETIKKKSIDLGLGRIVDYF